MIRQLFLLLLLTTPFSLSMKAKLPSVKILAEALYPLCYFNSTESSIKGFGADIINKVFEHAEIDYSLEIYPWARAYADALSNPNTLIFAMARIPKRESNFIWLYKILDIEYGIYTVNKLLINSEVTEIKNLYITVTKDGISHLTLKKLGFSNFIFINDNMRIEELIERNRIEVIFTSSFWVERNLQNLTKPLYFIPKSKNLAPNLGLYYAMNKNSNPQLVSKLQKSFKVLAEDGTLEKLKSSALESNVEN